MRDLSSIMLRAAMLASVVGLCGTAWTAARAQAGWVFCAREDEFCAAPAGAIIHYGRHGVFASRRSPPGGLPCNNDVFGDPIQGVQKRCFYSFGGYGGPGYPPRVPRYQPPPYYPGYPQ
jgi:hypothetical protein